MYWVLTTAPRLVNALITYAVVRYALKARAAREGMSLSDYIKRELHRSAERPTMAEWLERTAMDKPIRSKQSAAELVRQRTAAWSFIKQNAKDGAREPAHASSFRSPCTTFSGVSFRIFKIRVSAGKGEPAAWNSERTTRG